MASWHADFLVGEWRVSPKLSNISKDSQIVGVKHKSMAVLVCLADANGEVVSRNDIMDSVWPGMVVTDDVLTQSIVELRKAFNDRPRQPKVIETIPKVGFRLIAPVTTVTTSSPFPVIGVTSDVKDGHWLVVRWLRNRLSRYLLVAALLISAGGLLWYQFDVRRTARQMVVTVEEPPSIAVLPFENMSGDEAQDYFADGVTEEIINTLTNIDGLRVVGRTSSFSFKGKEVDLPTVGRQLKVNHILEGSVRRSGKQLRITAQLVNAEDGFHLWSRSYDRELAEIFDVQEQIATAIGHALRVRLGNDISKSLTMRRTDNAEAYTWYLRARSLSNELGDANALDALAAYQRVIDFDPKFAPGYNGYVYVCYVYSLWGDQMPEECRENAKAAARLAIALNPDSSESYIALAHSLLMARPRVDYHAASEALQQALSIEPRNSQANALYGIVMFYNLGDIKEAIRYLGNAVSIEPLDLETRITLSEAYREIGRLQRAESELHKILALDREYVPAYFALGSLFAYYKGDYVQGIDYYRRATEYGPLQPWAIFNLASWYLDLGDPKAAEERVRLLENQVPDGFFDLLGAFRVSAYRRDSAMTATLSRSLASKKVVDTYYLYGDFHWLRVLQRNDAEMAYDWYSTHYPELSERAPVIMLDNLGVAISFAELLIERGEDDTAARLLDASLVFMQSYSAKYETAWAALYLLQGDPDQALQSLNQLAEDTSWRNGWWKLRVDPVYKPLWGKPKFESLMQTIEVEMQQQLNAVRRQKTE